MVFKKAGFRLRDDISIFSLLPAFSYEKETSSVFVPLFFQAFIRLSCSFLFVSSLVFIAFLVFRFEEIRNFLEKEICGGEVTCSVGGFKSEKKGGK